jgi:DNA gyrase inhibitor GyrI
VAREMAADDITQRHLERLRIRGAPSTIPGSVGFVGSYDAEETWRQTARALVAPLDKHVTGASLQTAFDHLTATAAAQHLSVLEEPLFALRGDPTEDPPHKWEYEAVLPIRGAAKGEGDVSVSRVQGGMHIFTLTPRGLGDLRNVYVYLFGKFMPAKKQQLMRPYILHRVVDRAAERASHAHDDALTIAVYVPAVLSIKPVVLPGESSEA